MSKIHLGSAWPLGSTITEKGVNFSVAAPDAESIDLLIFSNSTDKEPAEIISLDKRFQSGDYWHIEVEGLASGACYCYRVTNQKQSTLNNSYQDFLLLDPCARAIGGWEIYERIPSDQSSKNYQNCLKAVVCEREKFNFDDHPRPNHPWDKTIIYELHVDAFTHRSESEVPPENQGKILGLIKKIPYLKDLGVTTVELLPVFAFDSLDAPIGLRNYWGYSPLNWFTPHKDYITSKNPLKARQEFREFVAACHDEGLEVVLDVVYNHTTEGNEKGPVISWKGFGDSIYYHKDKKKGYLDVTGCGNTISANHPIVRNLILESMRCWSNELGIDGFRFDLGIALSRGVNLIPLDNPPLFEAIESDPSLSQIKLISEPWDCGGLYRLNDFPAKRISTWNGRFRDDFRRFWKGDKDCTWDIKDRLMGSPNLYERKESSTSKTVNFITSHDGFTLADLVSFNSKHNLANGENNRDGDNHNNSWNHGVEGPSSKKSLNHLRSKQQRNLLACLMLSPGVPMILMGDEVGRSQGGNNNSWCQDSPISWMIWDPNHYDKNLYQFLKKIITIRKILPELFSTKTYLKEKMTLQNNNYWVEWHGIKLAAPDWGSWSHTISYSINRGKDHSVAWIGLNAYNQSMFFDLPEPSSPWIKVIDSSISNTKNLQTEQPYNETNIQLEDHSMVLMLANEYANKLNAK